MVKEYFVQGYDAFKKCLKELEDQKFKTIYVLFTGEKVDGISWCSDCNDSAPAIKEAVGKFAQDDSHLITVDVGGRTFWKDSGNPFRHDASIGKIQVIPTLIKIKSPKRLEGVEQCAKLDLLEMFFEDDE